MEKLSKRVLLIGWDGADWKLIDPLLERGQMPNLEKLINAGVMGNIASLIPMLSPILWTSIATGKHADKHGILGSVAPDTASGTTSGTSCGTPGGDGATSGHDTTSGDGTTDGHGMAAGRIGPPASTSRRCRAVWNILSDRGADPLAATLGLAVWCRAPLGSLGPARLAPVSASRFSPEAIMIRPLAA